MTRKARIAGIVAVGAFCVGALPLLVLNGILLFGIGPWATPGAELLVIPGFGAFPVALVGVLLLPFRKTRPVALLISGPALALFLGTLVGIIGGSHLRMRSFELAAERARPLVEALANYHKATGQPPTSFSDVVPSYLPAMPKGLPPLEIVPGAEQYYRGNPYVLRADVQAAILNFDEFYYFPLQNYPARTLAGSWERIADWAYLHE
jgi:hypothetical protein